VGNPGTLDRQVRATRLRALSAVKRRAEEDTMADRPSYVYVTYIESSPERVWEALTDPDLTAQYWGHSNVSDWQPGSSWEHRRVDGSGIADVIGTVLESAPPRRLTMTFDSPGDAPRRAPHGDLRHRALPRDRPAHRPHENLADGDALAAVSAGWPAVCANLKSLLETGHVLPRAPWEMHNELRAAQMARNDPQPARRPPTALTDTGHGQMRKGGPGCRVTVVDSDCMSLGDCCAYAGDSRWR